MYFSVILKGDLAFQNQASLNISQAFPAGSGPTDRTTYMFTYVDPQPQSPKLEELLEEYWKLMPEYQVSLELWIVCLLVCYL